MGKVAIIDYGMGNLHSVSKALEKVSSKEVIITSNKKEINNAERIVIPGVGAIKDCMKALRSKGLDEVIIKNALSKPTLAICVGMQLLLDYSEENNGVVGLGILEGRITKIPLNANIKIPHMGWNQVKKLKDHYIWKSIDDNSFFYFVHSYFCAASKSAISQTNHGYNFVSALAKENILAVQFHPEKSQRVGLRFYKNFINWNGDT